MLVKELIGKLNSYNMDATINFDGGNNFEIEVVNNENEIITDGGNAKEIIFRVINAIDLTPPEILEEIQAAENETPPAEPEA